MPDQADRIAELTQGFTGREWVFEILDAWLGACTSRLFLLTGGPGTGKSTLAARLVQMSEGEIPSDGYPHLAEGAITFFHFCQALNDPTLDALRFVHALSPHLADCYEPFALALTELGDQQITIDARQTDWPASDCATGCEGRDCRQQRAPAQSPV
jgi:hypothetical protein